MELKRRAGAQRGFTVLEALFAMLIFSVALIGSMGLLNWMTAAAGESARHTQASSLAQGKVEELRGLWRSASANGTDNQGIFTRTWTSTAGDGGQHVVVNVSWAAAQGNGTKTVTLRTWFYQ